MANCGVKNDTLLTQPFMTLSVNIDGERGLLGVALICLYDQSICLCLLYSSSGLYNNVVVLLRVEILLYRAAKL